MALLGHFRQFSLATRVAMVAFATTGLTGAGFGVAHYVSAGDQSPAAPQGAAAVTSPAPTPTASTGPADLFHIVVGKPGPQGTAGKNGSSGTSGAVGPQGPQGPQGLQGPKGDAGADGVTGPQGPQGDQGIQGAQGIQGPQGATGAQGPIGPQGVQGDMGPQGPQGSQGDVGPVGPEGAVGPIGPVGPQGPQGDVGATGPQGAPGAQGPQGDVGPQGVPGPTGPQGVPGPQGPTGASISVVGGGTAGVPVGVQRYVPLWDSMVCVPGHETDCQTAVPSDGTFSNFFVTLDLPVGSGNGWRVMFRVNGNDTTLFCDINDAARSCSNTTDAVSIHAGDLVALEITTAPGKGQPTGAALRWTAQYKIG
jgi:hypothetical protein